MLRHTILIVLLLCLASFLSSTQAQSQGATAQNSQNNTANNTDTSDDSDSISGVDFSILLPLLPHAKNFDIRKLANVNLYEQAFYANISVGLFACNFYQFITVPNSKAIIYQYAFQMDNIGDKYGAVGTNVLNQKSSDAAVLVPEGQSAGSEVVVVDFDRKNYEWAIFVDNFDDGGFMTAVSRNLHDTRPVVRILEIALKYNVNYPHVVVQDQRRCGYNVAKKLLGEQLKSTEDKIKSN